MEVRNCSCQPFRSDRQRLAFVMPIKHSVKLAARVRLVESMEVG